MKYIAESDVNATDAEVLQLLKVLSSIEKFLQQIINNVKGEPLVQRKTRLIATLCTFAKPFSVSNCMIRCF